MRIQKGLAYLRPSEANLFTEGESIVDAAEIVRIFAPQQQMEILAAREMAMRRLTRLKICEGVIDDEAQEAYDAQEVRLANERKITENFIYQSERYIIRGV